MVRLAWRMLRDRPASAVATFVALCFGVAVVTGCGMLLESAARYHGAPQRYAASTALIGTTSVRTVHGRGENREVESVPLPARGHVDASLVQRAAALPDVRSVVGDVGAPVQVLARDDAVSAEAHPWSATVLAPFVLRSGRAPAAGEVAIDGRTEVRIGAHPGSHLRLATSDGVLELTVSGIVAARGAAPETATVFLPDTQAGALAGHPATVDVVGVIAAPGTSTTALRRELSGLLPAVPPEADGAFPRVYTGSDRGLVESPDVSDAREMAVALPSVFGGCTIFIAVLVIAGTVSLSVQQRHREIALLRAIAATPRQVRRMVVREAALIGVVAGGLGVWAGLAAARWMRDQFVARGMAPHSFTLRVSWLPPLVAVAIGLVIAVAAAWIASLRASRIHPTEALVESSVERRRGGWPRALLGAVVLAGGITLAGVSMQATGDNAIGISIGVVSTLVASVALLAPWVNRGAAAIAGPLLRRLGVTGRLAAANAAASARRLSGVVGALVLAVGLGGSIWFFQTSVEHRAAEQNRAGLLVDYAIVPAAAGIAPGVAPALRHIPGVIAATGIVDSTWLGHDPSNQYTVQGVEPAGLASTVDLNVTSGRLAALHGATVALDRLAAESMGVHVGENVQGWFADGTPATLRVVAIYTRGLGFAQVTMPINVLRPHTSGWDDAVLVRATTPSSRIAAAVAPLTPGAGVVARHSYQAVLSKNLRENAWANRVVIGVLLVYVVIAAVNTLVMSALARRREIATLRLTGTTRVQILRMVRLEQALLLSLALIVGGAIAAATLVPMVKGATGTPMPYIPPTGWVTVIGATVLLGLLATIVPVRRLLLTSPVEAIGMRE